MRARALILLPLLAAGAAFAQPGAAPPLLPPAQGEAIAAEVSGARALATVRDPLQQPPDARLGRLSRRRRGDPRPACRLWPGGRRDPLAARRRHDLLRHPALAAGLERALRRIVGGRGSGSRSWAEQPISLAQDSVSGRAEADLVDIGAGTSEADYQGKEVRGRLVLTSSQPGAVQDLAIGRFGAAGIVSWAQNQRTAWYGDDESLVRWGHLETFSEHPDLRLHGLAGPRARLAGAAPARRGGAAARRGRCRARARAPI